MVIENYIILFKLVIQVILIQSTNSYFTFRYLRIVVCRYTRNDKTEIISYVR